MSAGALISVEEYLHTDYSPDCDYVDGEVQERNAGERPHSLVQSNIIFSLRSRYSGVWVWPEQRVQVSKTRFRLPDVRVTLEGPGTGIFHTPPFIAIEILSSDDPMSRIEQQTADYLALGVPHIWIVDPRGRAAHIYDADGTRALTGDAFATQNPPVQLPLASLFE